MSVFIDESGDFGAYENHAPYYLVSMVLHDQSVDIHPAIDGMDQRIRNLGYENHALHTGPLIRREPIYENDSIENRRNLFHILYYFSRKLNYRYICVKLKKRECKDEIDMTAKLSKKIATAIRLNAEYFEQFNRIVVYYDNGQIEMTKILTSVFNSLYSNVEFRKVRPVEYRLFQVADLVCTMELLSLKSESNAFTKSESDFFRSIRTFRKDYLKDFIKKRLTDT